MRCGLSLSPRMKRKVDFIPAPLAYVSLIFFTTNLVHRKLRHLGSARMYPKACTRNHHHLPSRALQIQTTTLVNIGPLQRIMIRCLRSFNNWKTFIEANLEYDFFGKLMRRNKLQPQRTKSIPYYLLRNDWGNPLLPCSRPKNLKPRSIQSLRIKKKQYVLHC